MENNEQLNRLFISYFSGQTSAEEDASVVEWVNADEQNRLYFENLQNAWRLTSLKKTVDNIDIDQEWNRFNKTIASRQPKIVSMEDQAEYENEVNKTPDRRKTPVYKILIGVAVAASLILLVGIKWNWFGSKAPLEQSIAQTDSRNTGISATAMHHEINTSGTSKNIVLQDGSEIQLANNSELTYELPFTGARNITLKGKASFNVAKDKARPFTVFSEDISTTVLGTRFTVDNYEEKENITVSLYEGSVVVKSVDNGKEKLRQDYILSPGYQLVYNKQKITARLSVLKEHNSAVAKDGPEYKTGNDDPSIPLDSKGSWYMFNNQPLSEVFDQLQAMYNVEIEYSKKEIANMYFIGKFEKTDSLERMLGKIALANSLKVTKKDKKFVIHK